MEAPSGDEGAPDSGGAEVLHRPLVMSRDWFDVIVLSGGRVALVVGDVVGHDVHASATMGRLRTAVRTLADADFPPDELLTRLDDLVIRLDREEGPDTRRQAEGASGEVGAPRARRSGPSNLCRTDRPGERDRRQGSGARHALPPLPAPRSLRPGAAAHTATICHLLVGAVLCRGRKELRGGPLDPVVAPSVTVPVRTVDTAVASP